jgi:hypothetical protein
LFAWAIVDSRVFLPVFSDDYYAKNHCRNEMDLGHKRYVDQRMALLAVAQSTDVVPEAFDNITYIDAGADLGFVEVVKAAILKQIDPGAPAVADADR